MILVLTPLVIEQDALRAALGTPDSVLEIAGLKVTRFGRIATAVGGHGKVQFALHTQALARELKPALIVCTGACGALERGLKMLDVVAATFTIEHDYTLRFEKRPLPRFPGNEGSLLRLKEREAWPGFRLHLGAIASGDEDVIDAARAAQIRDATMASAVAWEGAGGARAAKFCGIPFLELRMVTDTADEHAPRDFIKNVQTGMKNIAAVLASLA